MKIKKLPLDLWMEDYADYDQGILSKFAHKQMHNCRQHPLLQKHYPRAESLGWSDGQYLVNRSSFFIRNGITYEGDAVMFRYNLREYELIGKISRTDKILALRKLEIEVYGSPTQKTNEICAAIQGIRSSMKIRKEFLSLRKKIVSKKVEGELCQG